MNVALTNSFPFKPFVSMGLLILPLSGFPIKAPHGRPLSISGRDPLPTNASAKPSMKAPSTIRVKILDPL